MSGYAGEAATQRSEHEGGDALAERRPGREPQHGPERQPQERALDAGEHLLAGIDGDELQRLLSGPIVKVGP